MFEVRKELTASNILEKVTDLEIFTRYCSTFKKEGVKFNSELRKDPVPSAIITRYNGKLWYKDFGKDAKAVDCFGYIMMKFNINFNQALEMVNSDFNLKLRGFTLERTPLPVTSFVEEPILKQPTKIIPVFREWISLDIVYWKNGYYIDKARATRYGVTPVKGLYIIKNGESKYISMDIHSYAYFVTEENGIAYYKVYSPFNKIDKWVSNCTAEHYFGFDQLPLADDKVIVTKSLKDVMVLSFFHLASVAPQSESQVISETMYKELKLRFKKIYILYDNDAAGRNGTAKNIEKYPDIIPIFVPESPGVTDISDYIYKFRYVDTKKLLDNLIP